MSVESLTTAEAGRVMRAASKVFAASARAICMVESMKIENQERESQGLAIAYDALAFYNVIAETGISDNQVIATLNQ